MPGPVILDVEVTHVSTWGFWLLVDGEELMLPFSSFPWFRIANIHQLTLVKRLPRITSIGQSWMWTCNLTPSATPLPIP